VPDVRGGVRAGVAGIVFAAGTAAFSRTPPAGPHFATTCAEPTAAGAGEQALRAMRASCR